MRNIKHLSLVAFAAIAFAACSDNTPGKDPEKPDEVDVVLKAPSNLQVHSVTHNSAIVTWEGDTNALCYDIFIPNVDTLEVLSTSCGFSKLQQNTTYSWQVRARREASASDFVAGPTFTTESYNETIAAWIGDWSNKGWNGSLTLFGTELPYSEFSNFMPDTLNPVQLGNIDLKIEDGGDGVLDVTFPSLAFAGPFPTGKVSFPLDGENRAAFEQPLSSTFPLVREPVKVNDLPFLSGIGGDIFSNYGDVHITTFDVTLTKLTIALGPPAGDSIPLLITIDGTVNMVTDDALVNIALSVLMANNTLKIKVSSALYRKEE